MFILILTYKKALNKVDKYLDVHKEYLDKFYEILLLLADKILE